MMPLVIRADVIEEVREFFENCGAQGLEGTAMIAGRFNESGDRLVVPVQHADRRNGCWVEVPVEGKHQLAAELRPGEIYVARIHSHPGEAFHSGTDSRNSVLSFNGAFSIVVPFFGLGLRNGFDRCAVYVLSNGTWTELPAGPVRDAWVVVR